MYVSALARIACLIYSKKIKEFLLEIQLEEEDYGRSVIRIQNLAGEDDRQSDNMKEMEC